MAGGAGGGTISTLDPLAKQRAAAFLRLLAENGIQYQVTSTLRTIERQAQLYAAWRAGTQRYPVALPGRSAHNYGYALDLVHNGQQQLVTFLARRAGLVWFGAADPVHYDLFGPSVWRQILREAGL